MWLPLSNLTFGNDSTLAISSSGIALGIGNKKPQLLTDSDFQWKDMSQLAEILIHSKNVLKNQNVKVILSNTFVRYLVLHWQDGVMTQADWQAIAQHEFRKQFGVLANDWLVQVNLAKHGQKVLAAAIDRNLYLQLQASAKQLGFNIIAIEPLFMSVFNQKNPSMWTLIAEPERLLLCQMHGDGWRQVLVDSPPAGHEYQHSEQLIQRSLLRLETTEQPSKIATYVSAALNKTWQDNIGSHQKLMTPLSGVQPHALWMAELSRLIKQTQKVQLDFTGKTQTKTNLGDVILLLGAISLAAFLWICYQQIQAKTSALQEQAQTSLETHPMARLDPVIEDKLKFAQQAQQQLNLPWMSMLSALEKVKKANPNVEFLNISPNKNRTEIKLNGEATAFADITRLLDILHANNAFSDAVLVNQHLEQDTGKPESQVIYVFEINVGWRL